MGASKKHNRCEIWISRLLIVSYFILQVHRTRSWSIFQMDFVPNITKSNGWFFFFFYRNSESHEDAARENKIGVEYWRYICSVATRFWPQCSWNKTQRNKKSNRLRTTGVTHKYGKLLFYSLMCVCVAARLAPNANAKQFFERPGNLIGRLSKMNENGQTYATRPERRYAERFLERFRISCDFPCSTTTTTTKILCTLH